MERKSGFKECPRCGLRNKPSAAQCDFCGWEFRDVSDEWISHVQVLEKLNKSTESIVLDDEVSKRIESTIVRGSVRDAAPSPTPRPEARASAPPAVKPETSIETEAKAKVERWPERRVVTVPPPAPVEEREVKNFVETMIGEPVSAQAAAEVHVHATETILRPIAPAEPLPLREEKDRAYAPGTSFFSRYYKILLMSGVGVYAVTLLLYSLSFLSVALGWGLAIAGALLITFGVSHLYDAKMARGPEGEPMIGRMENSGEEVIICPRCHEEVSEKDSRCPSCGAAFSR